MNRILSIELSGNKTLLFVFWRISKVLPCSVSEENIAPAPLSMVKRGHLHFFPSPVTPSYRPISDVVGQNVSSK